MLLINEWLPNPAGSDARGEWVELWNGGPAAVDLSGWTLAAKGGKTVSLGGRAVGAGEYLLLPRTETRLALHNTDGALALYDASGRLADEARFLGTAPEGKSFARHGFSDGGSDAGNFMFVDPTPGAKNIFPELALAADNFPVDQPLNPTFGAPELIAAAFGGAALLAALLLVALKKNENLSNLFFGRDAQTS